MESNIKIKKGQIEDYAVQLAGTETDKPIKGDLEISSENKIFTKSESNESGIRYFNDEVNTAVRLYAKNIEDELTEIELSNSDGIYVQDNRSGSKGIVGNTLFNKQNDPNAFAQLGDIIGGTQNLNSVLAEGNEANKNIILTGVDDSERQIASYVTGQNRVSHLVFYPDDNYLYLGNESTDGGTGSSLQVEDDKVYITASTEDPLLSARTITVTGTEVLISDNGFTNTNFQGAKYSADFSENFVDRSLVDKAYVDSVVGVDEESFIQKSTTYTPIHNLISLTQIEYDAIEEKDATTIYFIQ